MKTALLRLVLAGVISASFSPLHAQSSKVPNAMNYQGLLTDSQGNPVAPTSPENTNVEFRLYSQPTDGTPLWGEAQTVTVFKGNFSVILGNGTALSGVASSGATAFAGVFANATTDSFYFGITPQSGAEFTPRQKVLSSAFALRAKVAESVNGLAQPLNSPAQFNAASVNQLTLNGDTVITGNRRLLFGVGDPDKLNSDAGTIGYKRFSQGLDIVGAGNSALGNDRKITLWAENGTEFTGPISFSGRYGQHVNLFDTGNGIGVQEFGAYFRTFENFSWFRRGVHSNTSLDPGTGGTRLALLNASGFTLNAGKFTGDGSGLTNINPDSLPNTFNYLGITGSNAIEFGQGVPKASLNGLIYYDTALNIIGAGTQANYSDRKITLGSQGGLQIFGSTNVSGAVTVSNGINLTGGSLDIGSRLGMIAGSYNGALGIGTQNYTTYFRTSPGTGNSQGSFAWYRGGTHSDIERNGGGGTALAYLDGNGLYVAGTVTANGTIYANGNANYTGGYAYYARQANGAAFTGSVANTTIGGVSIFANRILASEFNATSDSRIKLITGRSDSAQDLQTLLGLEITDYTKKDQTTEGARKFKKVIAQQVEKVYPQVVTQTTGDVPDIFRMAKATGGFITLKEAQDFKLKKGETIRLLQAAREIFTEVTEVTSKGFAVKEAVEGDVFVYGRKVNDLRTVDYEGIAMLNVSATQELYRQVQAQAAALAAVRKERDALAQEVAALRKTTAQQDQRFASIEEKLAALARQPAVIQAKLGAK